MKLTEKDIANIICGSQDGCTHRLPGGTGSGNCGDCRIPAHIIFAIETGAPINEDRIDGNHAAQKLVADHT